jgi:hypothetical protein
MSKAVIWPLFPNLLLPQSLILVIGTSIHPVAHSRKLEIIFPISLTLTFHILSLSPVGTISQK